jgi:hypothetical protein
MKVQVREQIRVAEKATGGYRATLCGSIAATWSRPLGAPGPPLGTPGLSPERLIRCAR